MSTAPVTIAARVPADLRADLERLTELTHHTDLSATIRRLLRAGADLELGQTAAAGGLFAAPSNTIEAAAPRGGPAVRESVIADLRRHVADGRVDGVVCPVCDQYARTYRRAMSSSSAAVLLLLYRFAGAAYIDLPRLLAAEAPRLAGAGGYATLAHWWGLIEREPGQRDDGSCQTGIWRLTPAGRAFVRRQSTIPRYAVLYNGHLEGLEGADITIDTALAGRFNYDELMGLTATPAAVA